MTATPTIATRTRTPRWATVCAAVLIVTAVIDVAVTATLWHAAAEMGLPVTAGEANPLQRHLLAVGGPLLALGFRLGTATAAAGVFVVAARRGQRLLRPLAITLAVGMALFAGWEIAHIPAERAQTQQAAVAQRVINWGCVATRRIDVRLAAEGKPTLRPLCGSIGQVLSAGLTSWMSVAGRHCGRKRVCCPPRLRRVLRMTRSVPSSAWDVSTTSPTVRNPASPAIGLFGGPSVICGLTAAWCS